MDVSPTPVLELNWGTVSRCPPVELVDVAARAGFPSVTVSRGQYETALACGATTVSELRARLDDTGVRIGYLDNGIDGLPGVPAAPDALATSEELCYRFADTFGTALINVTHYTGRPVPLPALVDAVGALARRAAAHGVSLAIEFLPGTGIPDLRTAVQIVDAVHADNLGILFDSWHHWRSGGRLTQLRALRPGTVRAIQLSDMPAERVDCWLPDDPAAERRNSRYRPMTGRLLPGEGVLPLRDVVTTLRRACPDVPLGAEVFSERLTALPPDDTARLCADAMWSLLTSVPAAAGRAEPGGTA